MSEGKVLGLEQSKYVKIAYILIIISAGLGLLLTLAALLGMALGMDNIAGLLGLAGLIMAALGWLLFAKNFGPLEINHLKYIVILFLIFFVAGLVLGPVLAAAGIGLFVITTIMAVIQLILILTGFNSYCHGRLITKENIQGEIKAMVKRA